MAKTARRRANAAGSKKGPAASRSTKGKTKRPARPPADGPKRDRLSAVDVPMGKGVIASVRFDTPKGKALRAKIERFAKAQPSMRGALFTLLRTGLEVETGKNLWKKSATVDDIEIRPALEKWAKKKWPDAEDRPTFKALLYTVLAAGLAVTTHEPARPPGGKRAARAKKGTSDETPPHDPTERTAGGTPKRPRKPKADKASGSPRVVDQQEVPPIDERDPDPPED